MRKISYNFGKRLQWQWERWFFDVLDLILWFLVSWFANLVPLVKPICFVQLPTRTCDLSIYPRAVHHVVERVESVPINITGDVWLHWPWLPNSFPRLSAKKSPSRDAIPIRSLLDSLMRISAEVHGKIALSWKLNYPSWDTFALSSGGERVKIPILIDSSDWKQGGFRPCNQFKRFWRGGNMGWRNEMYPRPFLRTLIIPIFVMFIILSVEKWLVKE